MKEVIDVIVSFDTSFEDIELLRMEMEKFVRAPENSRDFLPDITISVSGIGELDKLTLKIAIKHKSNWHNEAVRATRRSRFMCALTLALKRVPINAPGGGSDALGGPKNPQYTVAVSDAFAVDAREKSDKEKEAKKLANQHLERSDSTTSSKMAEQRAAEHLNTTDPVAEALDDWGYDNTLNSRDPSADRKRAIDLEEARRDFQHARESQRGRRKAGETIPPMAFREGMPSVQVTRSGSSRGGPSFDLERQAGLEGTTPAQYGTLIGNQAAAPPYTQNAALRNLTVQTGSTQPSQNGQTQGGGTVGARPRGASLSGPPPRALGDGQSGNAPGPSGPR